MPVKLNAGEAYIPVPLYDDKD